jgi:hypothetical protein
MGPHILSPRQDGMPYSGKILRASRAPRLETHELNTVAHVEISTPPLFHSEECNSFILIGWHAWSI